MTYEDFERALAVLNIIEIQETINAHMWKFLEDNDMLPFYTAERLAMGEVDEWPDAEGEFGRCETNPILVNRTLGELKYLSRLVHEETGQRMIFHRLGSLELGIDLFELISEDGNFYDLLYVDMYHHHCSQKAPKGYQFLEFVNGITGTSEFDENFPRRIMITLTEVAESKFGAPIVSPAVKNLDKVQAAETIAKNRMKFNPEEKVFARSTF